MKYLAILVFVAGCLGDAGVRCADGVLCPDDTTCAVVGGQSRCVTADQLAQCKALADRTACTVSGTPGVCRDEVCVRAGCGDGQVTGAEQCDGAAMGSLHDCRDLGYYDAGALACNDDCTIDRTGCAGAGKCGDGIVNGGEACDGAALPNGAGCENYPITPGSPTTFHAGGDVACAVDCTLSFASCKGGFCGDNVKEAGEACDGFDVGSNTCAPYAGGVTCNADCTALDFACSGSCGDGEVNGGERCDVVMPAGIDCATYGFHAGAMSCLADCTMRTLGTCHDRCGDGAIQAGETCDGIDQGGLDCASFGARGALGCTTGCQRDLGTCQTGAWVRRTSASFGNAIPSAIWSQNGVAAWIVGQNAVFEWNGTTLVDHRAGSAIPSGVVWRAVYGDRDHVWIAGDQELWRYESATGVWVAEALTSLAVRGLWSDGTKLWAATSNGIYARLLGDPASWAQDGAAGINLLAIHGRGDTIVATGPAIFRKVGSGPWTQLPGLFGNWNAVQVWSATNFWLETATQVSVYVEDPTPRVIVAALPANVASNPLLRGLFVAAGDDVYVAAQGTSENAVIRFSGVYQGDVPQFAPVSIGSLPTLGAVGGSNAGDVWVGARGAMFHHDGVGWQPAGALAIPAIDHTCIAASAHGVWMAGHPRSGTTSLVAYAATAPVPVGYTAVDGAPIDAMWTDGTVTWIAEGTTLRAVADPPATPPAAIAIPSPAVGAWGSDGHVFVALANSVMHFDGATWAEEALPGGALRAIGGSSSADVWAMGARISHRTGGTWTDLPLPPMSFGMTAVWSAGPNDAWAAGTSSTADIPASILYHWDGAAWTQYGSPQVAGELSSLWGSSPFDIWAVGTLGVVLHYDGLRWTPISVGTFEHLRAVAGTGPDDVWAVGDNGARLRLTHRFPITTPGACAGAVSLYCGATMPAIGSVYGDLPAFYRIDLPDQGAPYDTAIAVTASAGVAVTAYPTTAFDARCDLGAPLALPIAGKRGTSYYLAVRRTTSAPIASYALQLGCSYAPVP